MQEGFLSDFLFSIPSSFDGIASLLDLFGNYTEYNDSKTEKEADMKAYLADISALKKDAAMAFKAVTANVG